MRNKIGISIAIQLARIAPLLKNCKSGTMLNQQGMHLRPLGCKPRPVKELRNLGKPPLNRSYFSRLALISPVDRKTIFQHMQN
jgi:hypothetical protein